MNEINLGLNGAPLMAPDNERGGGEVVRPRHKCPPGCLASLSPTTPPA